MIFDLGDTVMHEEAFNPLDGYIRLLQFASNQDVATAQEAFAFSYGIAEEVNKLKRESMLETGVPSFLRLIFDQLGISLSISYAEMEREFWDAVVVHRPSEGLFETLDILDAVGIKTGILSNTGWSGDVLVEDLAKHNLAHRFSFVMSSADYGIRKPHRQIFEVAAKKMGLFPEDIWFVGDSLDYDVAGAINARLFPVWYNPKNQVNTGYECLQVRSWREFGEKVEELYRQ